VLSPASFVLFDIGTITDPVITLNSENETVSYSSSGISLNDNGSNAKFIKKKSNAIVSDDGSEINEMEKQLLANLYDHQTDIFYPSYSTNKKKLKGFVAAAITMALEPTATNIKQSDLSSGATSIVSTLDNAKLESLYTSINNSIINLFDPLITDTQSYSYWNSFTTTNGVVNFNNNDRMMFSVQIPYSRSSEDQSGSLNILISYTVSK
tara:strand:- start:13 stop:639 length:627 start_codon:yes stop_codon:yes gene_type:complete